MPLRQCCSAFYFRAMISNPNPVDAPEILFPGSNLQLLEMR